MVEAEPVKDGLRSSANSGASRAHDARRTRGICRYDGGACALGKLEVVATEAVESRIAVMDLA